MISKNREYTYLNINIMHFVFSYDLSVSAGSRRDQIVNEIESIVNNYRNVRRLTTFYIIHINNIVEWNEMRLSLVRLSQNISENFHFIMTPPQVGGHYDGILARGDWNEINEISNM